MKETFCVFVAGIILLAGDSVSSAQTWVATSAPKIGWHGIACSADGSKVVAAPISGQIYLSTNGGTTWSASDSPNLSWAGVVSSADGSKLAAAPVNGPVFTSTNGGMTWDTNALGTPSFGPWSNWSVISASADGNTLLVSGGNPPTFISTNWGVSWTNTGPDDFLESAAFSADGTRAIGCCSFGGVYMSADSGLTWRQTTLAPGQWNAAASSADGSKLVVGDEFGTIRNSTDFGSNWSGGAVDGNANWLAIASSTNGANLVAVSSSVRIYVSTNSGQTWSPSFSPDSELYAVASSADGAKSYAAQFFGQIYALQSGPPMRVVLAQGNPMLTLPDYALSDYALQENADLTMTNWSNVTNTPVNTNGQSQFVLAPASGSRFFRLLPYF